eukprot:COSAG04_NODE_4483_length_2063_cov_1.197556_3_plen_28_part_01
MALRQEDRIEWAAPHAANCLTFSFFQQR